MIPFLYLLKRNAINYIKSIKHKPSKAIPFIFYGIMLACVLISGLFSNDIDFKFKNPQYLFAVCSALTFILFVYIIYSGIIRKNFKYSLSDVNLIFTSPIKSQTVLLYGFIREIAFILVFASFFLFQLPNLTLNFKFVPYGILVLIITAITYAITLSFISLLMYGIFSKLYKYRDTVAKVLKYVLILSLLSIAGYIYLSSNGDYLNYTVSLFNKSIWQHIPISGWATSLVIQCINGFNASTIIYLGLLLLTSFICGMILYNFNLDFYEDALPSAELNEVAQSYKNSGYDPKQLAQMTNNRKIFARKKVTLNYSGNYAKAIFFRHMLEYKKTGFYFLNIFSAVYFVTSIIFGACIKAPLYVLLIFSVYIMVLSSYGGKWSLDFNGHYIFLIPASSTSKLFYSTLSSIIKYAIDGFVLFIPAGILLASSPIEILLSIISYISFGAISTYSGVLNYKLFDKVSNQVMKSIFMMFTLFVFIIPGIAIGIILSFALEIFAPYSLHISFIIYNTIISLIVIFASKSIYDNIES